MLEAADRYYGEPRHGLVIYNGRNPGLLNPYISKEDLVVAVGRVWDKAKQVSLLVQAKQNVPVWIAGDEQHPDPGFRGERQLASIYAATSQYEPFGLAPLEAALSRCAIVANDIPSFRELWGESVCYFRHNDAADLAQKIEQLQSDPELRKTYGNLAYNRARQRYTAERMVNDYMNLYHSLVAAGAAVA
jgi:hypothetical protein